MPSSAYHHINHFVDFLQSCMPKTILDVGMGGGKHGFVARDLLDVAMGKRYRKKDWQIRIDGIEADKNRIQDHQRAVYDCITIGKGDQIISDLGKYDMIVLNDVQDHFEEYTTLNFLNPCFEHCNDALYLIISLADRGRQNEDHKESGTLQNPACRLDHLAALSNRHAVFQNGAGQYGAFLITKEKFIDHQIEVLKGLAFDAPAGAKPSEPVRIVPSRKDIARIDLTALSRHVADDEHRGYFLDTDFREHYRLIAYLSTQFDNARIYDIGTNRGYSALALSYNPSNDVISYDIVECKALHHMEDLDRIDYRLGDVLEDQQLAASPLVMLDTNHDGGFEGECYRHLRQIGFKGFLFLDDIHLNPAMEAFWASIEEPKQDVTHLGHWSGSGLVDFSANG